MISIQQCAGYVARNKGQKRCKPTALTSFEDGLLPCLLRLITVGHYKATLGDEDFARNERCVGSRFCGMLLLVFLAMFFKDEKSGDQ
jgi:hypothetical protein